MKFICLKYLDKNKWDATPTNARRAFLEACRIHDQNLRETGHFFATSSAQTAGASVGLRVTNGQLVIEDDPSVKARRLLDGLMFLEARDLNHAITLMGDHPAVRVGWFEIHPAEERSLP